MNTGDRVIVKKSPPEHLREKDSPPCSCKGREGVIVEVFNNVVVVRFDSGGRAGIDGASLAVTKTAERIAWEKEQVA
jgi:hypothetical protein